MSQLRLTGGSDSSTSVVNGNTAAACRRAAAARFLHPAASWNPRTPSSRHQHRADPSPPAAEISQEQNFTASSWEPGFGGQLRWEELLEAVPASTGYPPGEEGDDTV